MSPGTLSCAALFQARLRLRKGSVVRQSRKFTLVRTVRPEEKVQQELIDGAVDLGWRFVSRDEMNKIRAAHLGEAVVEPLLIDALQKLNEGLSREDAEHAAEKIRRITDAAEFHEILRTGLNFPIPGRPTEDLRVVDLEDPSNNDYVVTEEFVLKTGGIREPRLDVPFIVNGLPLSVVENKASTAELKKAARDFADYWKDAPDLTVFCAIAGICNGSKFRVAASGATGLSKYAEWKDTYPHDNPADAGEMETVLLGVLDPHTLVDLAANYIAFETRDGVTSKKLARYQQYRAADKIVRRVKEGLHDRGIVWHTQGSGKSLTMIFTARKLLASGLNNPTVLIVVDRVDLDEQINDTLTACDFDGVAKAETRAQLRTMLDADHRGVIVTTVHKVDEEMAGLIERENVIVLVDEAHRSQEGDMGIWMRKALGNAKLFAFTGTPIETNDHSTRKAFSPQIENDGGELIYEDYLDAYRIKEAIDDGATLPIIYEPRLTEWALQKEDVDEAFASEFADLTEEQRAALQEESVRRATIAKKAERVEAIVADATDYLAKHTAPQGFKAQFVAVDREACALVAEECEKHLQPDEFAVVMSRSKDVPAAFEDDPDRFRRWYAAPQVKRLGITAEELGGDDEAAAQLAGETEADAFALSMAEKKAVKALIKRFLNPNNPLKLLIVNNMLLTGFDAPVEQVMFLDRGLSGHNLLQAIARTNRPAPGKDRGVIIDYWGVFSSLEKALKVFNEGDVARAAIKIDELREQFPEAVAEALATVAGFPENETESKRAAWLLVKLEPESDRAARFQQRVEMARSIYETLAPDPGLADHLADYRRLVAIHTQWRLAQHEDAFDPAEYRAKTAEIIQNAVDVAALSADRKQFRIDGKLIELLEGEEKTPEEKAAEIEAALVHEIKTRGEHDPIARSLAERLRALTERKRESDEVTLELLEKYEQLALSYQDDREKETKLGLSPRAQSLLALAREHAGDIDDDALIEKVKLMDQRMAEVADFDGWQDREDVLAGIRKAFIEELATDPRTLDLATGGAFVEEAVQTVVARAEQPQA